jgi:hypothetical protein
VTRLEAVKARVAAREHYSDGMHALANCHQHTGSMGVENATFHAMLAAAHFAAGQLVLALHDAESKPG